jgi:hypothetical protein
LRRNPVRCDDNPLLVVADASVKLKIRINLQTPEDFKKAERGTK